MEQAFRFYVRLTGDADAFRRSGFQVIPSGTEKAQKEFAVLTPVMSGNDFQNLCAELRQKHEILGTLRLVGE